MKLRIQSTISLQGKYSYIFCSTFQKLILISNIQFLQDNPRYLASEIVKNSSICHVYKYFRDQRCPTMSSEFIYDGLNIIPPIPEGGGVYCFTSVRLSVRPRYFSAHFSQYLLMAEIWYLVTSMIFCSVLLIIVYRCFFCDVTRNYTCLYTIFHKSVILI